MISGTFSSGGPGAGFTSHGGTTLSTREQPGRSRERRAPCFFILAVSEGKVSSLSCEHYLSSQFCLSAFAFRRLRLSFFTRFFYPLQVTAARLRSVIEVNSQPQHHLDVLQSCLSGTAQMFCQKVFSIGTETTATVRFFTRYFMEVRISCAFQPDFHLIVAGFSSPELLR